MRIKKIHVKGLEKCLAFVTHSYILALKAQSPAAPVHLTHVAGRAIWVFGTSSDP